MALPSHYTRLTLAERPKPDINDNTFKVQKEKLSTILPSKPSQVLVQVDYVSLDPAMRGWLDDRRSYIAPVEIGATMRASGIGRVVKVFDGGNTTGFSVGDLVTGHFGWTEYALIEGKGYDKIEPLPGVRLLDYLGALGLTGHTAYFGLLDVGQVKPGETLVVSGAAGAVGSIVCQIGKIIGAKVIAIAGGPQKCQWLEQDLGVHKALDYKSPTFVADFKKHVGYLDVYFDNVGGDILDLCLTRLNKGARISLCGGISDYGKKPKGLQGYLNLISMRAKIEGFIVFDYRSRYGEAEKQMAEWIANGKLKTRYHIEEGLQECPRHLLKLFQGANTGKMVVRVSHQEPSKL